MSERDSNYLKQIAEQKLKSFSIGTMGKRGVSRFVIPVTDICGGSNRGRSCLVMINFDYHGFCIKYLFHHI